MSVRNHRNPYLRKTEHFARKDEASRKRDTDRNRAALARELRNLVRTTQES